MTESRKIPTPLLRQPSSLLERALLNAGVEERASDATRVAVLEVLGLERRPAPSVTTRWFPVRRGALLLAAMVVSAAAVAVPLSSRVLRGNLQPVAASPNQERIERDNSRQSPAGSLSGQGPVDAASETQALPTEPQPTTPARAADASTGARNNSSAGGRNPLAAELAALDAARAKLTSGDGRAALILLDGYQREFPKPRLALEAEVLRIDALDRSGQSDLARKRAATFVRNHPKGVLTGRVRRYLER